MSLRILTICTANVCRSPMAAAFLARYCELNGLDAVVRSSGTHAGTIPVDPDAVTVMAEHGLPIAAHVPRLLTRSLAATDGADLMIPMTRTHLRTVATMGPGAFQRSFTAKELVRRAARLSSDDAAVIDRDPADRDRADRDPAERDLVRWHRALGEGRLARELLGDDPDDDLVDPYGMSVAVHRRTADELDSLMAAVAHSIAGWLSVR